MFPKLELVLEGLNLKVDLLWLRDHCRCELCYNEQNSNRIGNLLDIPDDVNTEKFKIENEKLCVVCK